MKHIRKGIAISCMLALLMQLFVAFPAASADTVQAYRLVDKVEAGKTYVIVADDTYALNNKGVSYNNQDTLGATAVAISDGVITSEVTEDMLWTVRAASGVEAAIDGREQYFIYDQAGMQLSRKSGSTGTAPLAAGAYDAEKPQYSTWSFADREAGSAWTMYVNSYRDSDYPFTLRGAAGGFNAPGEQRSQWTNDYKTYGSAVKFYALGDAEGGSTEPEAPVSPAAGVEAGRTYVVVADGKYALTNNPIRYSEQNTLGSVPVTVSDGAVTSDVTYAMLWTFRDAEDVQAALNGEPQYFIFDGDGKQLNRLSGSTGTAPIQVGEYDASKPQYSTWSLHARDDGSFTMYVNSYRDSDYYFALTGAEGGFNAPGKAQSGYDFAANGSSIVLYDVTDKLDDIEKPGEDPGPDTPAVDPSSVSYDAIFLSDLHNGVGGYNGLKQMMAELKAEGVSPRVLSHGGDYVEDGKGGTVNWESQVYGVIHGTEVDTYPSADTVYTMGNHDWESARNGGGQETMGVGRDEKEAAFKRIFGYDRAGLAYADDELEIYLIGAQNETGAGGGGESFIESEIEAFDAYLASRVGSGKVIFLQTHWPAHSGYNFKQRTVGNADKLIDTMNKYAEDLDIVFVWGHNHYEDVMRYEVKQPGDEIMYSADTSRSSFGNPVDPKLKTLKFTYVNAGCMNDMWYRHTGSNNTSAANNWRGPAACLSVAVDADTITFTYNRIKEVNGVWTYSHDANIDIRGTIHEHPATVVVDRVTTDHEHEFEVKEVVEPTCTEGGYTVEQCKFCERTRTANPVDALGHDWDEGVETTPPTAEKSGVMTYTCRRCGETRTEKIPRLPGGGLADIDFTAEADAGKYEIAGQSQSAVEEGVGLALVTSQGGVEPAKQNIAEQDIDVVKVPVSGDWTATLEVEFDANGAANGYYQFFGFLASEGGDNRNMVGIRGGDGAMQDFLRKDGAITEEQNSSTPGFDTSGKTYFLRIDKEGDAYTCSRSDDGEAFTEMFAFEGTGIEADELLIDAYTGLTAGYRFTLKSLAFEGGAGGSAWTLAEEIVPGGTYVIVADGKYAMTNAATATGGNYSDGGDSLGACEVTVEDGEIVSDVDDSMLWTIEAASDAPAARDGAATYYIFDQEGKQLIRRSGRTATAPLSVGEMNPASPQYAMISFYQRQDGSYAVYTNSHQSNDYNFTLSGNANGFDAPGVAQGSWDGETYGSSIRLYTLGGSVPVRPDKTALRRAIAEAEAVNKAEFTDASVAVLEAAVAAARTIQADENATQDAVDAAAKAVTDAIAALEPVVPPDVDKSKLDKAISDAEAIDKTAYTEESVAALEAAVAAAKTVQADKNATQAAVNEAEKAVKDAVDALVPKPVENPKEELQKAVEEAEKLDTAPYTEASVAALEKAIEDAKAVLADENATAEAIAEAEKAVKDAVEALKEKPDDFLFEDVKDPGKFYFDPVYWAFNADPQITKGTDDTHFGPDNACTRGHVVTFLWRAAGEPEPKSAKTPFTDLKPGAFYEKAVAWAVEEGITKGLSDTTFGPDATCTRGQIVTFLWRFKDEPAPKSTQTPFTDVNPNGFYMKAVAWAVEEGVTKGLSDTAFGPDATCTRGQVVTFLFRATGGK